MTDATRGLEQRSRIVDQGPHRLEGHLPPTDIMVMTPGQEEGEYNYRVVSRSRRPTYSVGMSYAPVLLLSGSEWSLTSNALPGGIGGRFESFDSTSVGGGPDPIWSLVRELSEALNNAKVLNQRLNQRAEALVSELEIIRSDQEASDADEGDVVVFGDPHRKKRIQGRIVRRRRGEPLFIPEDFGE